MTTIVVPPPFHTAAPVSPPLTTLMGDDLAYVTKYLTDPERACPGATAFAQWVPTKYWHETRGAWCLPNHYPGGAINPDAVFARPLHYDAYTEAEKQEWLVRRKKDPEKDRFPKAVQLGPEGFPVKGLSSVFIGPTAIKLLEAGKKEVIFVEAAPVSEQVSQLLGIPTLATGGCWNGIKSKGLPKRILNEGVKAVLSHYKITSVTIWNDYDEDKQTILRVSQGANQFEAQLHEDFKGLSVRVLRPHTIDGLCATKSEPAVQLALFASQGVMPGEAWKKLCETGLASTETIEFWKVESHYVLGSQAIAAVDEAMSPFLILAKSGLQFLQKSRPIDPPIDLTEFAKLTKHLKVHCKNMGNQKKASLSVSDCLEWSEDIRSKYVVSRVVREQDEAEGLILDPNAPNDVVYNSPIPLPTGFKTPSAAEAAKGKVLFDKVHTVWKLVNDPLVIEDYWKTIYWARQNPGVHPGQVPGLFGVEGTAKTTMMLAGILPFGINKNTLPLHYRRAGVEPEQAFGMFGRLPEEKFSHDNVGRSVACGWDESNIRPTAIARAIKSAATTAAETREMNKAQRTMEHGQLNSFNGRQPPYLLEVNGSNRRERFLKLLGYGSTYTGRVLDATGLGKLYGFVDADGKGTIKDMGELKEKMLAPLGMFIASYPLYIYQWIEETWPDVKDYNPFSPVASSPKFPLELYEITEVAKRVIYEIPEFPVLFGTTIDNLLGLGFPQHTNPSSSATDLRCIPNYTYNPSSPQTHLGLAEMERKQTGYVTRKDYADVWFNYLNNAVARGLPKLRWQYDQLIQRLTRNNGELGWELPAGADKEKDPQTPIPLDHSTVSDSERDILRDCLAVANCDLLQIARDFYAFKGSREDEVY